MRTLPAMVALLALARAAGGAPLTDRYALIQSGARIGTLTATRSGAAVELDYRVDDNGRGAKWREHLELAADGAPRAWEIKGQGWIGAPVQESFHVAGGQATWRSLDDSGQSTGGAPLYLPNNTSPWAYGLYVRLLRAQRAERRALLPGGEIRAERLREVRYGKSAATAYALWGADLAPQLVLLDKDDRFAGWLSPGQVLIDERDADQAAALAALAGTLSAELLHRLTVRVTHRYAAPLWLKDVRVFDARSGRVSGPTAVVVYGDRIAGLRDGPPPPYAAVVEGGGGTLLPGLCDMHAHSYDWGGPLHIAAGVTQTRDPGNDNRTLLTLSEQIDGGAVLGPRIARSGFLEGRSPFSSHGDFVIATLAEGVDAVRWYADHGFTGIKIYNSMDPAYVGPLAAEAHRLGLRVHGHVPAFMTSEQALRAGYDEINHINQLMLSFVIGPREDTRTPFRFTALGERVGKLDLASEPVRRVVRLMRERHTTLDPTMQIFANMLLARPGVATPSDQPWLDHMPASVQRGRKQQTLDVKPGQHPLYAASWQKLKAALLMLYQQGVRLVPGTDDLPGMTLHSELQIWGEAGIPGGAVLQAATLRCAEQLGRGEERGAIEAGRLADLLLVEGDPTQDLAMLRKVRLVLKGGAVYQPAEILSALGVQPFAAPAPIREPAAPRR